MSSPHSPYHIPVGKLVSVNGRAARPTPLERALPARDREVPWLLLSVAIGVGVWLVALTVLALNGVRTDSPQPRMPVAVALPPAELAPEALEPEPVQVALAKPVLEPRRPPAPVIDPPPLDAMPAKAAPDAGLLPGLACAKIGTNIVFLRNPPDAFRLAKKEGKLVFMVHLSGNFEDTEFT